MCGWFFAYDILKKFRLRIWIDAGISGCIAFGQNWFGVIYFIENRVDDLNTYGNGFNYLNWMSSTSQIDSPSIFLLQALASGMKCYCLRLKPGEELKSSLMQFAKVNNLTAAFIMTCCGSVSKATLRFARGKPDKERVSPIMYNTYI